LSSYSRILEPSGRRFYTGHPIFDRIFDLRIGMSILMLDETFSEAYKLLNVLFNIYGKSLVSRPIEVSPYTSPSGNGEAVSVGDRSLSDISIAVNKLRMKHPRTPFIHTALPDMIIKNNPDDTLRLLTAWQKNIHEAETIEFYILPRGTFGDLERKILSVVDGGIEIRLERSEGRFRSYLKPIRCCRPDFHLREFSYILEGNRLIVEWEGQFTDSLPHFDEEEISRRVNEYKNNLRYLKVTRGEKQFSVSASVYDYWLLSQIRDKNLASISEIFPEDFDQLLRKIAVWQTDDVVRVVRDAEGWRPNHTSKTSIGLLTRLGLTLPSSIASLIFRSKTGKPRSVPLDVFLTKRRAYSTFLEMFLSKMNVRESDYIDKLLEMQKKFYEAGSRVTVLSHIKALGENPELSLDVKYLPKLLKLSFNSAYGINPSIHKISENEYKMEFYDCFECAESTSNRPICAYIEGSTEGICGVLFKMKTVCKEVECKAMGDNACTFKVKLVKHQ